MTSVERLLTADEFMELPSDPCDGKMELFDGRVIVSPPPGESRGRRSRAVFRALDAFVLRHGLGEAFMDVGFRLRSEPPRVVSPDVAFIASESLTPDRDETKAVPAAPTLAVEVVSPGDVDEDVAEKVAAYLDAGTARVWVVRPRLHTVTIHRDDGIIVLRQPGDTLTSDDAGFSIQGFTLPVAQIFAD
jgi:Uma2 family endonuclease